MDISDRAIEYIKDNKNNLYSKFVNEAIYKQVKYPTSFFMAGSPGAGKTEYSKRFIKIFKEKGEKADKDIANYLIVRIDADDIREMLPDYNGSNSSLFQGATSLGVSKLYDFVLKKKLNALIDGTFSSYKYAEENIKRSLNKNREVYIFYIYQDPILAWKFTKIREIKEGRNIPIEVFVEDFFESKNCVNKIKKIFKTKVNVDLIKKDYNNKNEKVWFKIDNIIDNYINFEYTKESLLNQLKEIKI